MPTLSCNSVSAHSGNTYNSVWIQWNPHVHKPSRETLLQALHHLPETVSLLLDTFRDTFSLYWKQKGPDGPCVKHQKGNFIVFAPSIHVEIAVRYNTCQLQHVPPTVPSPAKAQGPSHLMHQLCMGGINKQGVVFKTNGFAQSPRQAISDMPRSRGGLHKARLISCSKFWYSHKMQSIVLSALHVLNHLILVITFRHRSYEEPEAQRSDTSSPGSHS